VVGAGVVVGAAAGGAVGAGAGADVVRVAEGPAATVVIVVAAPTGGPTVVAGAEVATEVGDANVVTTPALAV
jgi:hypothetical protein